ncbi:class I SAM-dependent methyltransferase [Alicyclobacillus tolerans]|uniref:class I SAM-dependent methyltransferase n=1 Tax=Alicyclobacillus tolerans TaxID=90970 RepID=UPI003B7E8B91
MDDLEERVRKTSEYYDIFAEDVSKRTETRDYSRWIDAVCSKIPSGSTILDIGCGSGQHMRTFASKGYITIGVEPSSKMRSLAVENGLEVFYGTFENLDRLPLQRVNAIWCAASLLHVPKYLLNEVLSKIWSLLQCGGVIYITVRMGSGCKWDHYDGENENVARFIQLYNEYELIDCLQKSRFQVLCTEIEESYWGRPSKWINILAARV